MQNMSKNKKQTSAEYWKATIEARTKEHAAWKKKQAAKAKSKLVVPIS